MKTLFLLALSLHFGLWAQSHKLFWDGNDWLKISEKTAGFPEYTFFVKSAYLNGLQDGRLYDYYKLWPADSVLVTEHLKPELEDYLSTAELVRVLDNYYKEPLNRYIPIASAILIVNMTAQGQSASVVDEYARRSKDWINSLMLEIQNEDQYKMMREKQKSKKKE